MTQKLTSLKILQTIVRWLNKTCNITITEKEEINFANLFNTYVQLFNIIIEMMIIIHFNSKLFFSVKDARKLFRLFKSIIQYQKLKEILLDDQDNLLKVFRVICQIFFFFYWFFDNISIACKIKLIKGNFNKLNIIASIFWLLSNLVAIPVNGIQAKTINDHQKAKNHLLDSIKYIFDIFPSAHDARVLQKLFNIQIHPLLVGFGGLTSATISSYEVIQISIK